MRTTSLLNAILAVTLVSAITVSVARGQAPLENTPIPMWVPDGAVTDVVKVGNTLVVGGGFEYVGPPTGPFAIVDAADAASLNTGATFTGSATRIVPDGSGGWLVVVDACACGAAGALEHVSAAGIRDPQFVPASGISAVRDLAVEAGRLFVAGFTPQGQGRLVALDPATGALLTWTPAVQPRDISSLVAAGGVVYVNYARPSGFSNSLALDAATGAVVPFPALQDSEVIAAHGNRVYLMTRSPAGQTLSAYTTNGQRVPGFPDILYASLESVVASPTLVFVSGTLPGTTAYATQVAALDASTATPVWSSPVFSYLDVNFRDGGIGTLAIDGTTLYVGGRSHASVASPARAWPPSMRQAALFCRGHRRSAVVP